MRGLAVKRNVFLTLAALCPVALFVAAGCSSSGVNPNITVYSRDTVADRDISLPGNYSTENYRRLTLATMPGALISNSFSDSTMKSMSLRMQSELSKIKRFFCNFTVILHNVIQFIYTFFNVLCTDIQDCFHIRINTCFISR